MKNFGRIFRLRYKYIVITDISALILTVFALKKLPPADPISVFAYLLSSYALATTIINLKPMLRRAKQLATGDELAVVRIIKAKMRAHETTRRWLEEKDFRAEVSLRSGLCMNLFYAVLKWSSGLYYHSAWLISVGVYYLIFALIRFVLLRNDRCSDSSESSRIKAYRSCGIMLFAMNAAMAGMAVQMVVYDRADQYSKTLVILSAAYTFYMFTLAAVNMVKFRKSKNRILTAAKDMSFVGAVMSMFSLQTSMLATFSGDNERYFRRLMNALMGGAVTLTVLIISVMMMIRSARELNALSQDKK